MKNQEVINHFITQDTNIKGNNLFIDDNVLYSYGYHYPLSIKVKMPYNKTKFIVNNVRYSTTTTKHKNLLLNALNKDNVIFMTTDQLKEIINKFYNQYDYKMFNQLLIDKLKEHTQKEK